jgi:hypothetical protein
MTTSKAKTVVLTAALAAGLAGCRADLTSELYVQDIRAWSSATTPQKVPVTLTAYVMGAATNCNELWQQFQPIMRTYFGEPKLGGCTARPGAMEDALTVNATVDAVAVKPGSSTNILGLLAISIMSENVTALIGNADRQGIYVQLHANPEQVAALQRELRDRNVFADFGLEGLVISIAINNDERDPAELVLRGVFADGVPIDQGAAVKTVPFRSRAIITLGDVKTASLLKNGSTDVATLLKREKPGQ